jgi:hypothetical protein
MRTLQQSLTVVDMSSMDLWRLDPKASIREARERLGELHYDVAPLDESPVRRYVELAVLDASPSSELPVHEIAVMIDADHLVSCEVPLYRAVLALRERPFYFILEGEEVTHIVTPSDLQQPSVTMAVLSLILACEPLLDRIIDKALGVSWPDLLSDERRRRINDLYATRRHNNEDLTLMASLNLDDRLTIVEKTVTLRAALGFMSRQRCEGWNRRLKNVRNTVAHGGDLLAAEGDSRRAIEFFEHLVDFAQRLHSAAAE